MSATKKATGRFKVWDWVSFRYGAKDLIAQVVEERGPLGKNRRHLYRVSVAGDGGEPDSFEMPEDEMEAVSVPDKDAIISYLKDGGLVAILRSNLGGGIDQQRAWLTYTPRGRVTHTFVPERGMLGGAAVPFFALHEDKVFAGKEQNVASFLASFGLNRAEAEQVISAVGTAP